MTDTLKQRTEKAREIAHALFKEAGYRESKTSRMDYGDRLWHRRFSDTDMHIHFEEYSYDNPIYPIDVRKNIPEGRELSFTVGTWSNTPHMRFEVHHVNVTTMMDIRAAEAKVLKFIEAFELTKEVNCDGDGINQNLEFIKVDPPKLGERLALLRMPILREKCTEKCPDVLRTLEEKRKTWEESYEVHFSVKIACANPPGLTISASTTKEDGGPNIRCERLNLIRLVCTDDLVDKHLYGWLRDEIESELDRLERRVRDA
jgi:hypothetical protein